MQTVQIAYKILVADDDPSVLEAIALLLRSEGLEADTARSPEVVLEFITRHEYDLLLIDLNYARDATSGAGGLELIQRIRAIDNEVPIVVMSAWGTINLAVEAMRRGARDFIQKPWDDDRLVTTSRNYAEVYRTLRQSRRLEAENKLFRGQGKPVFIANAPAMVHVLNTIVRIGPSDANVLITGEHGTGKEVVAQMLHAVSLRAERPLITVNTGGLPEGTFESELFGHVKGAFTDASTDRIGRFEMADGGTLFLDEIANVGLRQQAKLLRVLETGTMERVGSSRTQRVDVRLISATNADLQSECQARNFREDLLFRLNTVELRLPPLRDRREDIPTLAAHFLSGYCVRYGKKSLGFSMEAMALMTEYAWPGNVRELDHAVQRAVIMAREGCIQAGDLSLQTTNKPRTNLEDMSLEEVEALLISKALARYRGNIRQAADLLGLSRGTFYRRMAKYGLYVPAQPRNEKN